MTRRHARPMTAHERAQRVRSTAYAGAEAATLAAAVLLTLAVLALAGGSPT